MKYNFPKITESFSKRKQLEKIMEEFMEFLMAETEEEKEMEWLDFLHCTETFTRHHMNAVRLDLLKSHIVEKNAKRGYYGEKYLSLNLNQTAIS